MDHISMRQTCRHARQRITGQARVQAGLAIAAHAIDWLADAPAQSLGLFVSLPEEVDTAPLLRALWARGDMVYLPYVRAKAAPLCWLPYRHGDTLDQDTLGIAAPAYEAKHVAQGMALDVVFTPLVAWDSCGQRLGMGGGFYDRTFAAKIAGQKPLLIGLAYACQEVAQIQTRSWDVALDGVITEHTLLLF